MGGESGQLDTKIKTPICSDSSRRQQMNACVLLTFVGNDRE